MIFKKCKIWRGKILYEQGYRFVSISGLLLILSLAVLMFSPSSPTRHFINFSDLPRIIAFSVFVLSCYLFFYVGIWSQSSTNPGLAVDNVKELVRKSAKFVKMPFALIAEVEKTGDPTKLNKWRKNKEELIEAKKNMRKLKFRKNAIQNGKALEQINVKIATKKKRIDKLNSKEEV
jgi:fumarate reductase subunit C